MTDDQHRTAPQAPWSGTPTTPPAVGTDPGPAAPGDARPAGPRRPRLIGIDAARGFALIGMISIHIMPMWDPETFEPTAQWTVFAGRSAALFALLAGVGLAFSSGGRHPHGGRTMTADRVGVAVRALLIALLGLSINHVLPGNTPDDVPAFNILVYYGVFFLLAIPFLHLRARSLVAWAAGFMVAGPVLLHLLGEAPLSSEQYNPTFTSLLAEPGATLVQLLLTGTFPALSYMAYLLVGLGIGRLDLHEGRTQALLLAFGVMLAAIAWLVSWVLVFQAGGYEGMLWSEDWVTREAISDTMIYGPDEELPTGSWWWLAIIAPYTSTPLTLLSATGTAVAAVGFFLILARGVGQWVLPLSAMGSMTLTLYSLHLLALSLELHYDQPAWFVIHVAVAAALALVWRQLFGQGPLERAVAEAVRAVRRPVLARGTR